jgi:ankyrin repeat protein
MLLSKGADVSAVDFNKAPALFYAARWGQLEIVRLLLAKDSKAVTAISKNGNNILLDMLLYYGQNLKETENKVQFKKNLVDIARLLIDRGANVNAKARPDEGGVTPIMKAASYDNFELVKLFKEKGADLCLKDQFGTGLVDYLPKKEKDISASDRAIINGIKGDIAGRCGSETVSVEDWEEL